MSRLDQLLNSYRKYIQIPWRDNVPALQRVIFCVYSAEEELRLRARIDEFEIVTNRSDHQWALFDITDCFAIWMSRQRYSTQYFNNPDLLPSLLHKYLDYLCEEFHSFLDDNNCDQNTVVALTGVGSLFGFLKVRDLVDKFAPVVPGRLLVFFPGCYENNNYRLLDAYDGWNYLAIPITSESKI